MCMADIILQFSWEKLQSRQGALEGWVCFLHDGKYALSPKGEMARVSTIGLHDSTSRHDL